MESNHNEDESTMQQALLDKLMQYGDSLLDLEDYEQRKADVKKRRKKHKKERQSQDTINLPQSSKDLSIPKLKKKNKKLQEGDIEQSHEDANSDSLKSDELRQGKRKRRTLREFEEELRVFKEARDSDPVVSKEENVVEKPCSGPEVVVFDDPAKRKKKNKSDGLSQSSESNFDLNKARLEVQKFGYSGFDYTDRRKFEQERAIRLGAKPPKRDYVNYKLYMEQLKQKKTEEQKQKEIDRKLGLKVTTSKSGDRDVNKTVLRHHGFWKDRSTERGFHLDGQIGRYRPGVLWLTRKDIVGVTGKANKAGRNKTKNNTGGKSDRTGGKADFGGKSSKMGGKSKR